MLPHEGPQTGQWASCLSIRPVSEGLFFHLKPTEKNRGHQDRRKLFAASGFHVRVSRGLRVPPQRSGELSVGDAGARRPTLLTLSPRTEARPAPAAGALLCAPLGRRCTVRDSPRTRTWD